MSETCWECGAPPPLHHHHVVPRSRGGTRTVPLCEGCHARAHHRAGNMTTSLMTREAIARKRLKGEKIGGCMPYGYILASDGKTLVQGGPESEGLDLIRELMPRGLSLRAMARELTARGAKTRGKAWYPSGLSNIIRSEKKRREARDHLTTPQNNAHWDSIRDEAEDMPPRRQVGLFNDAQ